MALISFCLYVFMDGYYYFILEASLAILLLLN